MKKQISVIAFLAAVIVYGKVISVPGDFGTIQEGINNSAHTDTVLVSPGIYYENINFSGKNITLASLFLTTRDTSYTSQTIINGGGINRVISISSGETESAKLIGFTITNGYSGTGSGIYIKDSSPVISENIIKDNQIGWYGAGCGIYAKHSGSDILRNIIRNNDGAMAGCAIYLDSCSTVNISGNIISDHITNSGYGVAYDSGISIEYSSQVIIEKNLMYDNYVDFGYGDMIGAIGSEVLIKNCTFYNRYNSWALFNLNGSAEIENSIIWPDKSYTGQIFYNDTIKVNYSNIFRQYEGIGNFSADPLFSNHDTFELDRQSQCINRGNPLSDPDPDNTQADIGWRYYDLSGYGTVSGTVALESGSATMESVRIAAGEESCYPLSSGEYMLNILQGTYDIKAYLGIELAQTVEDVTVESNLTLSGIDFHLVNDLSSGIINVAKDGTGDFLNIQDAIKSCIAGDTIVVKDGIYNEELYINAKTFTLASRFITDGDSSHIENTVIDGQNMFRPLYVSSVPDSRMIIKGLTFQNGYTDTRGGGIYISGSNPVFSNCIIRNNTAKSDGGGIRNYHAGSVFRDCKIINNTAGTGGGFDNDYSDIKIYNSQISGNSAYNSGALNNYNSDSYIDKCFILNNSANYSGAICNTFDSELIIINSIITENNSLSSTIDFDRCNKPGLIMNNLIVKNNVTGNSCVVYIRDCSPVFVNNTITNNTVETGSSAVYIYSQNSPYSCPDFYNNIIWNNSTSDSTQIVIYDDDTCPSFYNNLIQYGKDKFKFLYNATPESNIGTYTGNIESDPEFLDEWNGDFMLTENSPCIDAGTNTIEGFTLPADDIASCIRIWDGDGNGSEIVDIGAYEYGAPAGIEDSENITIIKNFELHQNYPNPFNPATEISYSLKSEGQVALSVFNTKGELVSLLENGRKSAGNHTVNFNGEGLNSGIYFYRLSVDGKVVASKKMMMLK
jgi:hypothetical protein